MYISNSKKSFVRSELICFCHEVQYHRLYAAVSFQLYYDLSTISKLPQSYALLCCFEYNIISYKFYLRSNVPYFHTFVYYYQLITNRSSFRLSLNHVVSTTKTCNKPKDNYNKYVSIIIATCYYTIICYLITLITIDYSPNVLDPCLFLRSLLQSEIKKSIRILRSLLCSLTLSYAMLYSL
jgi:hypothetical protein